MIDKQIHIIHCDEVKLSEEWAPEVVNRMQEMSIPFGTGFKITEDEVIIEL